MFSVFLVSFVLHLHRCCLHSDFPIWSVRPTPTIRQRPKPPPRMTKFPLLDTGSSKPLQHSSLNVNLNVTIKIKWTPSSTTDLPRFRGSNPTTIHLLLLKTLLRVQPVYVEPLRYDPMPEANLAAMTRYVKFCILYFSSI